MIFNFGLEEIKEKNNTEKFMKVMKQKPADYFKDGSFQVLGDGDGQESYEAENDDSLDLYDVPDNYRHPGRLSRNS